MSTPLSSDDVLKVAKLARLKLSEAEVADYTSKLGQIVGYVQMLNDVNTDNVEPLVYAVEVTNVFRTDEVQPSLPPDEALSNAPKTDGRFYLVPQIL